MACEVLPVLFLPEELDPHLVSAWWLLSRASVAVVAVMVSDAERIPLVENFEALDEESFP